jgi:AcrR family transcriptional regulator
MTALEILMGIALGLLVNECCDVSPWLARKFVRWSAHRRYVDQCRAETRAEELVALIDDRPGKLFKLITALGFVVTATADVFLGQISARLVRRQLDDGDAVRSRIIAATVDCLVRSGYAGTTTARVMKLAGIRRSAHMQDFPTRADLLIATAHHIAAKSAELAFQKVDEIRQAPNQLEAALDLMWEVHQGPAIHALVELWLAARTDPELRERITTLTPVARATLLQFGKLTFGRQAGGRRLQHVVYTAMDTIRGVLVMGQITGDRAMVDICWRRAKRDLLSLVEAALKEDAA